MNLKFWKKSNIDESARGEIKELRKEIDSIKSQKKKNVYPIIKVVHKIPKGKPWRYMPDGITKYEINDQHDEKYRQKRQ